MHDEIKEIKEENNEAKLKMNIEVFLIYLKCLFYYPKRRDIRKKLIALMKGFFDGIANEEEILRILDKAMLSQEEFDEFLILLDDLFDECWDYYDSVLADYESALQMNSFAFIVNQNEVVMPIDNDKKQEILRRIRQKERK